MRSHVMSIWCNLNFTFIHFISIFINHTNAQKYIFFGDFLFWFGWPLMCIDKLPINWKDPFYFFQFTHWKYYLLTCWCFLVFLSFKHEFKSNLIENKQRLRITRTTLRWSGDIHYWTNWNYVRVCNRTIRLRLVQRCAWVLEETIDLIWCSHHIQLSPCIFLVSQLMFCTRANGEASILSEQQDHIQRVVSERENSNENEYWPFEQIW